MILQRINVQAAKLTSFLTSEKLIDFPKRSSTHNKLEIVMMKIRNHKLNMIVSKTYVTNDLTILNK